MRRWLILLCALWLSGCGREPIYQSPTYVFGTLVDIVTAKPRTVHVRWRGMSGLSFQRLHQQFACTEAGR